MRRILHHSRNWKVAGLFPILQARLVSRSARSSRHPAVHRIRCWGRYLIGTEIQTTDCD